MRENTHTLIFSCLLIPAPLQFTGTSSRCHHDCGSISNGSLAKHEAKMAGYWQNSCLYVSWTKTETRSTNMHKKEGDQYQAMLTKQESPIKNLLYDIGSWGNFSGETQQVEVPSGQDNILPT